MMFAAMSKVADKASKVLDHAMTSGLEQTASTAKGKLNYVAKMAMSGGTTSYWRKLFNPPKVRALQAVGWLKAPRFNA